MNFQLNGATFENITKLQYEMIMNKNLSILIISIIMFVVGFNPTIAMHFCNDELQTVKILQQNKTCCSEDNVPSSDVISISSSNECCITNVLHISTSEFQLNTHSKELTHYLYPTCLILKSMFVFFDNLNIKKLTALLSYNSIIDIKPVDVLTLICTYQI